jgi:hypothetical protein
MGATDELNSFVTFDVMKKRLLPKKELPSVLAAAFYSKNFPSLTM